MTGETEGDAMSKANAEDRLERVLLKIEKRAESAATRHYGKRSYHDGRACWADMFDECDEARDPTEIEAFETYAYSGTLAKEAKRRIHELSVSDHWSQHGNKVEKYVRDADRIEIQRRLRLDGEEETFTANSINQVCLLWKYLSEQKESFNLRLNKNKVVYVHSYPEDPGNSDSTYRLPIRTRGRCTEFTRYRNDLVNLRIS